MVQAALLMQLLEAFAMDTQELVQTFCRILKLREGVDQLHELKHQHQQVIKVISLVIDSDVIDLLVGKWLIDVVEQIRQCLQPGEIMIGGVDCLADKPLYIGFKRLHAAPPSAAGSGHPEHAALPLYRHFKYQ